MEENIQGFGSTDSERMEEAVEELLGEGWLVEQRFALGGYCSARLRTPADAPVRRTGVFLQVMIGGQPLPEKMPPFVYSDVWLFVGPFADDAACAAFRSQLKEKLVEKKYSLDCAVLRIVGEIPPGWIAINPEDFRGLGSCNGMNILA